MSLSSLGSSGSASSSRPRVNLRSTAVKRIMQEAAELADEDTMGEDFVAAPLESDIFEWHCTMRGVAGSEYEGGIYHFRILLPASYPMSPPDILLLTPNGRFEVSKKICIDGLTSFHVGSWQPAWGVRTAILGLRSFWMQQGGEAMAAVGAMNCEEGERRRLAVASRNWTCPTCQTCNKDLLPDRPHNSETVAASGKPGGSSSGGDVAQDSPAKMEGSSAQVDLQTNRLAPTSTSIPIQQSTPAESGSRGEEVVRVRPLFASRTSESSPRVGAGDMGGPVSLIHEVTPAARLPLLAGRAETSRQSQSPARSTVTSQTESASIPPDAASETLPPPAPVDTRSAASSPPPPLTTLHPLTPPATARPSLATRERTERMTPLWLDALIGAVGVMVLVMMARRLYLGDSDVDGALRASLTDL